MRYRAALAIDSADPAVLLIYKTFQSQRRHCPSRIEDYSATPPDASIRWPFTQRFSAERNTAIMGPMSSGTPCTISTRTPQQQAVERKRDISI